MEIMSITDEFLISSRSSNSKAKQIKKPNACTHRTQNACPIAAGRFFLGSFRSCLLEQISYTKVLNMLIGILCEVVTTVTAASRLQREIAINHVWNACVCLVHGAKERCV